MRKIKWGIMGTSNIAHHFASQFEDDQAEIEGVASRTLQKAYEFSTRYNVKKAYGTYEELAFDPEIDILYIATPNQSHYKNMLMALKADKHVLCEKPITLNKQQLDAVLTLAKNKNLFVAEAMTIYHMPLYKTLKKNIETGKYGKLQKIQTQLGITLEKDPKNRYDNPELGGGALFDIGVYALSFIRYFLSSQPDERQTSVSMSDTKVDEKRTFLFRNAQDQIASASLSFQTEMPICATLVCENASITVSDFPRASQAVITYADGTTEELRSGDSSKALTYEINALTQTLLSDKDLTSLIFTKEVNELIDWAAREWNMSWVFNEDK